MLHLVCHIYCPTGDSLCGKSSAGNGVVGGGTFPTDKMDVTVDGLIAEARLGIMAHSGDCGDGGGCCDDAKADATTTARPRGGNALLPPPPAAAAAAAGPSSTENAPSTHRSSSLAQHGVVLVPNRNRGLLKVCCACVDSLCV